MINVGKREELVLRRRQSLRSQFEVAAELGISQASYSLIENGFANPNDESKEKLIALFGLKPDYFDNTRAQEKVGNKCLQQKSF